MVGQIPTTTIAPVPECIRAGGMAVRTGLEPATSAVTGQHSKPTELPDRRSDFLHKGLIAKSLWVPGCGNVHTGSTHGLPLPFSSSDQDRFRGSARDPICSLLLLPVTFLLV